MTTTPAGRAGLALLWSGGLGGVLGFAAIAVYLPLGSAWAGGHWPPAADVLATLVVYGGFAAYAGIACGLLIAGTALTTRALVRRTLRR